MFFIEILRILPAQRSAIFSMLYKIVKEQGKLLEADINKLLSELNGVKKSKKFDWEKAKKKSETIDNDKVCNKNVLIPGTKEFTASLMFCTGDLHLNTLRDFTKRNSQPKKFLKSLETISYLRNQLKLAEKRKRTSAAANATESRTAQSSLPNTTAEVPSTRAESSGITIADANAPIIFSNTVQLGATLNLSEEMKEEKNLEDMLEHLDPLWKSLSNCLAEMSLMLDPHAVLSLQHAAEAFFLAHAFMFSQKDIVLDTHSSTISVTHVNTAELQPSTSLANPTLNIQHQQHVRVDMNKYTQSMFQFAGNFLNIKFLLIKVYF